MLSLKQTFEQFSQVLNIYRIYVFFGLLLFLFIPLITFIFLIAKIPLTKVFPFFNLIGVMSLLVFSYTHFTVYYREKRLKKKLNILFLVLGFLWAGILVIDLIRFFFLKTTMLGITNRILVFLIFLFISISCLMRYPLFYKRTERRISIIVGIAILVFLALHMCVVVLFHRELS